MTEDVMWTDGFEENQDETNEENDEEYDENDEEYDEEYYEGDEPEYVGSCGDFSLEDKVVIKRQYEGMDLSGVQGTIDIITYNNSTEEYSVCIRYENTGHNRKLYGYAYWWYPLDETNPYFEPFNPYSVNLI